MTFVEGFLLVVLLFPAACVAGYPVAALLTNVGMPVRLCVAALAGLALWLWLASVVNAFLPLKTSVAWGMVGATWGATLFLPYARQAISADFKSMWKMPRARWLALAPLPLVIGMLFPSLRHPSLVFFDGTSNHDSYFWISAAEWLQQKTYLTPPVNGTDSQMFGVTGAITGWNPTWGRMGTEALLALLASALNILPIKAYMFAQVGLLPFWLAAVLLFVWHVLAPRVPAWSIGLFASLQPIFLFFVSNNNIPNLLGALFAPVLLIAFVQGADAENKDRLGWRVVAILMLHSGICAYPEMTPFALLSVGLALLFKLPTPANRGRRVQLVLHALVTGLLGLAIQPLTTWRGVVGFANSFAMARANTSWGNLFERLSPAEYLPAIVSLDVPACTKLDEGGWLLSAFLFALALWLIVRAKDRATTLAALTPFFLLAGYTLATGFNYGWQKSVQFSGVIVASCFSCGCLAIWENSKAGSRRTRWRAACVLVLATFLGYTTVWGCVRIAYWAENKALDADFLALRNLSHSSLRGQRVEVVGATFKMAFFHSMWALYVLPTSQVSMDNRGQEMGGYLRWYVPVDKTAADLKSVKAYLVSRDWAETFDADTPQLSVGRFHALLPATNKLLTQSGLYPITGLPTYAQMAFSITLKAHEDSDFVMELSPRKFGTSAVGSLEVTYGPPDRQGEWKTFSTSGTWSFHVPLKGETACLISVKVPGLEGTDYPVLVDKLGIHRR